MRVLLFAGTTEGRLLAHELTDVPHVELTICVATEYGKEMLAGLPEHCTILTGRLNQDEIASLLAHESIALVVDATPPYAVEVSKNAKAAAHASDASYLRLLRGGGAQQEYQYYPTIQEAAKALCNTYGAVLVTTGSKELDAYMVVPDYQRRLYPRVLPTTESIGICEKLGFAHSRIIALQGPFSAELNKALMNQYDIRFMVTKDGGVAGGFTEKMEAASELGVEALIIGRPPEEGLSYDEVVAEIHLCAKGKS